MANNVFSDEVLGPMCHHRKCEGSGCLFEVQEDYNESTSLSRFCIDGIRGEFRKEANGSLMALRTRMDILIEQISSRVISGDYPDYLNEEYSFEDIDTGKSVKANFCLSKTASSVKKSGLSSLKKDEPLITRSDYLGESSMETLQNPGILREKNLAEESTDCEDFQLLSDRPSASVDIDETLPLKSSAGAIIAENHSEWKPKRQKIFEESNKRLKTSTRRSHHDSSGARKQQSTKVSSDSVAEFKLKYANDGAKQPSPSIKIGPERMRRTASKVIQQAAPSAAQQTAHLVAAAVPPALGNKRGISWNELPEKSLITPLKGCLSPVKRKNDETGTLTSLSCSLRHWKCLKKIKTSTHTSASVQESHTKAPKSSPPKIQDETKKLEVWEPRKKKRINWGSAPVTASSVTQTGKVPVSRQKETTVSTKRTSRVEVSVWLQKCSTTQVFEPYLHDSVLSEASFMQRKHKIKW